jgi:SSS family solute:Na+ symporter
MLKLTSQVFFGAGDGKSQSPAVLAYIADINFLYFSGILFVISVAIVLVVSYLTSPPNEKRIAGLTYASIDKAEVRASWNQWDVWATGVVLGLVAIIYLYFSFWV